VQPVRIAASLLLWLLLTAAGDGSSGNSLETCEARFAADPHAEAAAQCFFEQSRRPGWFTPATHRLRELLTQHPDLPWLRFYLGSAQWEQPAEAEALYRTAAGQFAEQGEALAEFRARINLYDRLIKQGHGEEAELERQRAILVAKASGNRDLIANGQILEIKAILSSGQDLGRASQLLAEAHQTLFPHGADSPKKQWLFASGEANLQIGRRDQARKSFRQLAELAAGPGKGYETAAAQYGLLRVLMAKDAEQPNDSGREAMLAQARATLAAAQAGQDANTEFWAQFILGLLTGGVEAEEHFAGCRKKSVKPSEICLCLGGRARKLAEEEVPGPAQEALREALVVAKQSEDPWLRIFLAGDRMRVSWRTQSPAQAVADSWKALDEIEALRRAQGPASRVGLFSTFSDDYYWFSGRLLEPPDRSLDDVANAFAVTERLRGRTLLEKLAGVRPEPPSTDRLARRLPGVVDAIRNVTSRVGDTKLPPGERENARQDLATLESEKAGIEQQIQSTASGAPGPPAEFATLQDVQEILAPDEALLSFQVAPWKDWTGDFGGGSWLTVVTRGATRVYPLLGREELRPLVERFTKPFASYEDGPEETLVMLHQKLLAPALADLPREIKRLVILPDDDLHKLPFAALHAAQAPPLVQRYQLTMAPSATLWRTWRRNRPQPAAVPALVLADPVRLGDDLQPLLLSVKEGEVVLGALGGHSLMRRGEDASEKSLKGADLSRYGILHLATHSVIDEENPERSSVRLTPGPGEDGHLEVAEILDLKMPGNVVVLSTCESAGGQILRGEGVMSLARAFFGAGAHTVVGSLWPIEENDGARLFERFYRHLGAGASVAAALRAAQRDRIGDGAPRKAWAGFVVLGDGDLVPLPEGRIGLPSFRWGSVLAGVALVGFPLAFWQWRRRQEKGVGP